jgi:Bacterial extracellular solute-binding proteins, family 3
MNRACSRLSRRHLVGGAAALLAARATSASSGAPLGALPVAPAIVRYPRAVPGFEDQHLYPVQVLRRALTASGIPHNLVLSDAEMPMGHWLQDLQQRRTVVDVGWAPSTPQREQQLLPVRIPIDKGLSGWRVLLVRSADEARFASTQSLADLRDTRFLQSQDWVDAEVLQANGLSAETSVPVSALFSMLAQGRGDAVFRSLAEAAADLQAHPSDVALERFLLLHCPTPLYFFVGKGNETLAASLELGLGRMVISGVLDRLFREHVEPLVESLNVRQRRVLTLQNPNLPAKTPMRREELWFKP